MKNRKIIEVLCCATLSVLFGAAFFFGALYPEYGMIKESYQIIQEKEMEKNASIQEIEDMEEIEDYLFENRDHIHFTSRIYEDLKNK